MVESISRLDDIFGSLADATRRDILKQVAKKEQSVGELAEHYDISLAAVSKHLMLLEKAKLVQKKRQGKHLIVQLDPEAFEDADEYLQHYRKLWEERFDRLEHYLAQEKKTHGKNRK